MRLRFSVFMLLLLSAGTAPAQSRACRAGGQNRAGQFDYYVLSLSWSPQHCATSKGAGSDPQCVPGRRFGFVLHGLWPQFERGFPADCASTESLDPATAKAMLDIMPSPLLVEHEWCKHGRCSGLSAKSYFDLSRTAFRSVRVPPRYEGPQAEVNTTPSAFKSELLKTNPALTRNSVAVLCSGRYLQEIRVCVGKDLKPRPCSSAVRDRCTAPEIIVRPVR